MTTTRELEHKLQRIAREYLPYPVEVSFDHSDSLYGLARFDGSKAVIVLNKGLLRENRVSELPGVFWHEVGHHVLKHVRPLTEAQTKVRDEIDWEQLARVLPDLKRREMEREQETNLWATVAHANFVAKKGMTFLQYIFNN